jgi:hypothetical protein
MKSVAASKLADAIADAAKNAPPHLESPDDIPEGTDMDTLDRWLQIAERNGRVANHEGNLPAVAQMGRLSTSLLEAKRKLAPIPTPDPNENPDMVKLGAEVEARFLKMIALVAEEYEPRTA